MHPLGLGRLRISAVVERAGPTRASWLFPNVAFVIQAPGLTALVDTCVGNDKDRGGRPPESIDVVICTHLHVDHVGWNTRLENGRWVPTFPRARHLFARREWEHWSTEDDDDTRRIMGDSVRPVVDAGLVELVEMDHKVSGELWLEPTPGHTPGHVSVRLGTHFNHPTAGRIVRHGDAWRFAVDGR